MLQTERNSRIDDVFEILIKNQIEGEEAINVIESSNIAELLGFGYYGSEKIIAIEEAFASGLSADKINMIAYPGYDSAFMMRIIDLLHEPISPTVLQSILKGSYTQQDFEEKIEIFIESWNALVSSKSKMSLRDRERIKRNLDKVLCNDPDISIEIVEIINEFTDKKKPYFRYRVLDNDKKKICEGIDDLKQYIGDEEWQIHIEALAKIYVNIARKINQPRLCDQSQLMQVLINDLIDSEYGMIFIESTDLLNDPLLYSEENMRRLQDEILALGLEDMIIVDEENGDSIITVYTGACTKFNI